MQVSPIEYKRWKQEIKISVRENVNSKKADTKHQEIWDIMKRQNQRTIGIEEGKEIQVKGRKNIFNKIIKENFLNLRKELPIKVEESYRA